MFRLDALGAVMAWLVLIRQESLRKAVIADPRAVR
jgi:hypothetical protein